MLYTEEVAQHDKRPSFTNLLMLGLSSFFISIITSVGEFQGSFLLEKSFGFLVASCPQADVLSSPRVVRTCV